jgi:hypothetical protein
MALWGKRDAFAVTGTVSVVNTSVTVTGSGTSFLTELENGESLFVDASNTHVKIIDIANNTSLTIGPAWATANATGAAIFGQDSPKYVPSSEIANIIGVDTTEAGVAANAARGLNNAGWNKYVTYTDMHGRTRYKVENLVAMSSITADAPDDSVAADS